MNQSIADKGTPNLKYEGATHEINTKTAPNDCKNPNLGIENDVNFFRQNESNRHGKDVSPHIRKPSVGVGHSGVIPVLHTLK